MQAAAQQGFQRHGLMDVVADPRKTDFPIIGK